MLPQGLPTAFQHQFGLLMPGVGKGQVAAGRKGAGAEDAKAEAGAAAGFAATGLAATFLAAGFLAATFLAAGFFGAAFFAAGLDFLAAAISISFIVKVNKNIYYTLGMPQNDITKAL